MGASDVHLLKRKARKNDTVGIGSRLISICRPFNRRCVKDFMMFSQSCHSREIPCVRIRTRPLSLSCIRLIFPRLESQPITQWARVSNLFAIEDKAYFSVIDKRDLCAHQVLLIMQITIATPRVSAYHRPVYSTRNQENCSRSSVDPEIYVVDIWCNQALH